MQKGMSLTEIKAKIENYKGQEILLSINKGRNKIVELKAFIEKVYPSMFIIKPTVSCNLEKTSYSYSEILCGDVKFMDNKTSN